MLFARYYQGIAPDAWLRPYAGYVSPGPHRLAALLCRLPMQRIPSAFALVAERARHRGPGLWRRARAVSLHAWDAAMTAAPGPCCWASP
ncbi:MAG: hypothetical protein AB7O97_18920 [Planctomycetota bacterium]